MTSIIFICLTVFACVQLSRKYRQRGFFWQGVMYGLILIASAIMLCSEYRFQPDGLAAATPAQALKVMKLQNMRVAYSTLAFCFAAAGFVVFLRKVRRPGLACLTRGA